MTYDEKLKKLEAYIQCPSPTKSTQGFVSAFYETITHFERSRSDSEWCAAIPSLVSSSQDITYLVATAKSPDTGKETRKQCLAEIILEAAKALEVLDSEI